MEGDAQFYVNEAAMPTTTTTTTYTFQSLTPQAGSGWVAPLGEKLVDHNPAFRLVLASRDGGLALPPDVAPLLTAVNFSTTRSVTRAWISGSRGSGIRVMLSPQFTCRL